jgi:hypothetical protein
VFLGKIRKGPTTFLGCPDYQFRFRRIPAALVNDRRYLIRPLPRHLSPPLVNENLRRQEHDPSAAATEPGYGGRLHLNDTYLLTYNVITDTRIGRSGLFNGNSGGYFDDFSVTGVPEPSTLALLALGMVGLVGYDWRRLVAILIQAMPRL